MIGQDKKILSVHEITTIRTVDSLRGKDELYNKSNIKILKGGTKSVHYIIYLTITSYVIAK